MELKEYILEFKKKNYKFLIKREISNNIIEFNINSEVYSLNINDIRYYLEKLNKISSFNHSEILERLNEYIEFINIINNELQVQKAIDQFSIILWNNRNILDDNILIKDFYEKNIYKNDSIKYYYFIIFFFVDVSYIKEKKNLTNDIDINTDWLLDNINGKNNFLEDSDQIFDFIF